MYEPYLTTADAVLHLLADTAVATAWDRPSQLPEMSVGGLAAHTARAVLTVRAYLDGEAPSAGAEVVDAAGYLVAALPDPDRSSDVNRQVLARAQDGGRDGHERVVATTSAALEELRRRLPDEPSDRLLAVLGGIAIPLDEYLATRLVELVVHADDLVASVADLPVPDLPDDSGAVAVGVLAEVARRRSSTRAMVRTLTRAERAPTPPPRAL